jgi:hypothetical protein
MPKRPSGQTLIHLPEEHAKAILTCDVFVAVTATFRMRVRVVIEHGTRRLSHANVTAHPSADWTLQQLRAVGEGSRHQYLIHHRDKIFTKQLEYSIRALGIGVLRSLVRVRRRTRSANARSGQYEANASIG